MFNFNHKRNKDSDKNRLKYPNTDKFPWYSSKHAQNLYDALTRESDDYSYPWHDRQASQESKPSEDSSPWYANTHAQDLEYFPPISPRSTKQCVDDDLVTPDKIHKYVENTEQSTRDYKILTDFTKWFNNYMKLRMQVDKKAKQYYISIAHIPAEFVEYNKTYHDYRLLKQVKKYLENHGWAVLYFNTGHSVRLPEVLFYALYRH